MPDTLRDGHRIHYEVLGRQDGPTLLLVMGLGLSLRSWDTLPALLGNLFRVIVFDNRGTGGSGPARGRLRMATLADDAAAVLRTVRVTEEAPAFVFGISLGGMIAQELVLRHPRLVRALALGATNAGFFRAHRPRFSTMLDFLALITLGPGKAGKRLARLCVSREFMGQGTSDFARWMGCIEQAGPLANLAHLTAVIGHSTHRRLPTLQLPTLIIAGDDDRIVPVENARAMAKLIPGSRLLELKGAGHVFPLERPQETVQALCEHFLGPDALERGA